MTVSSKSFIFRHYFIELHQNIHCNAIADTSHNQIKAQFNALEANVLPKFVDPHIHHSVIYILNEKHYPIHDRDGNDSYLDRIMKADKFIEWESETSFALLLITKNPRLAIIFTAFLLAFGKLS